MAEKVLRTEYQVTIERIEIVEITTKNNLLVKKTPTDKKGKENRYDDDTTLFISEYAPGETSKIETREVTYLKVVEESPPDKAMILAAFKGKEA